MTSATTNVTPLKPSLHSTDLMLYSSHQDQFNLILVARKPVFGGVRPRKTQTSLLSNRDQREAWNFGFSNYRYYTIKAVNKKKNADQTVDAQRSEPLLFTYGINRFSHDVAHLILNMVTFKKFNPNSHIFYFRGLVQDWRSMCFLRHSWSAIFYFHHSHCNKTRIV